MSLKNIIHVCVTYISRDIRFSGTCQFTPSVIVAGRETIARRTPSSSIAILLGAAGKVGNQRTVFQKSPWIPSGCGDRSFEKNRFDRNLF